VIAYIVTSKIDDRKYVGISRRSNASIRWKEHVKNAARGKRTYLYTAIREHGCDAFTVTVVGVAKTWDELCVLEAELINRYDTCWPNGYNMTLGGDGVVGYSFSEQVRQRLSETRKGLMTPAMLAARKATGIARIGKKHNETTRAKLSERAKLRDNSKNISKATAARKGKPLSDAHKRALSALHINLVWITNGLRNRKIPRGSPIPEGWRIGRMSSHKGWNHTAEARQKMSKSHTGKTLTIAHKQHIANSVSRARRKLGRTICAADQLSLP
jgi:group I intron endonuclease